MRPPICEVCGEAFGLREGGTVRFADYTPLPPLTVGHPEGLEWFCGDHVERARSLKHLPTREALKRIRELGSD